MKASLFHSRIDNEKENTRNGFGCVCFTAQAQVKTGMKLKLYIQLGFITIKVMGCILNFKQVQCQVVTVARAVGSVKVTQITKSTTRYY